VEACEAKTRGLENKTRTTKSKSKSKSKLKQVKLEQGDLRVEH
jgi:hypothetical protein